MEKGSLACWIFVFLLVEVAIRIVDVHFESRIENTYEAW